ncbi:hypothetical protein [Streptomyces melanogenes]|uniref:hypothetical protein n=1 Tax=Streptomyces melanogenes TaxID=67326 RepID=UPI003797DC8B
MDNDPELQVRRAAARRPDTPPEVLEGRVGAHDGVSRIRPRLVDHPHFSPPPHAAHVH